MKNIAQVLIVASLVLSGCAHVSPNYSLSAENVASMRALSSTASRKISVGSFTSSEPGKHSILCRAAGPIEAPQGQPFDSFIRDALVGELKLAGLYQENAPTTLEGKLTNIDFNSNIGAGKWTIQMAFSGNGVTPFNVESSYSFSTNFIADIACEQVSQALPVATKGFIKDVTLNPEFRKLFSSEGAQNK